MSSARPSEFELKQYELLKNEIEADIHETRALERYALLGTGAVWTFLAANAVARQHIIIWWAPFVLTIFCALRSYSLILIIRTKSEYLRCIESKSSYFNDLSGFATFWEKERRGYVGKTMAFFWAALLAVNLGTAILRKTLYQENSTNTQPIQTSVEKPRTAP